MAHRCDTCPFLYLPGVLLAAAVAALAAGCGATEDETNARTPNWETLPKVDVHAHYVYPRDYLPSVLDAWDMRAVLVEVMLNGGRTWREPLLAHQRQHSERFVLCTTFDASRVEEPDFAETTIARLRRDLEAGAKMIKVWKNVGLVYRDSTGAFVQVDDPRLQPIWDFLVEEGVPVLAHIGEPRAAWLPLDQDSPHYDYYANNPQYHFHGSDAVPHWEAVMQARDRWLAANPDLVVIGAHFGSMAYDTDAIAERLDRFANFYVDSAERLGDLVIQPTEKVRDFFLTYHDRILYGTDLTTDVPAEERSADALREERDEYIERRLRVHWEYLAGSDSVEFVRTGTPFRVTTQGLGLPADVLHDVYHRNAERLLGLAPAPEEDA